MVLDPVGLEVVDSVRALVMGRMVGMDLELGMAQVQALVVAVVG